MDCYWCEKKIDGWYIKYKGHVFCHSWDDSCIKNFLLNEADDDIEIDYLPSQEELEIEAAEFKEQVRKDLEGYYDS